MMSTHLGFSQEYAGCRESDYAAMRRRMADRLFKVLSETDDPRVVGDGSTFDKPPSSSDAKPQARKEEVNRSRSQ